MYPMIQVLVSTNLLIFGPFLLLQKRPEVDEKSTDAPTRILVQGH